VFCPRESTDLALFDRRIFLGYVVKRTDSEKLLFYPHEEFASG